MLLISFLMIETLTGFNVLASRRVSSEFMYSNPQVERVYWENSFSNIVNNKNYNLLSKKTGRINVDDEIIIRKANSAAQMPKAVIQKGIKVNKINCYNNNVANSKTIYNFSELRAFLISNIEVMNDDISFYYKGSEDKDRVKQEIKDIVTLNNTGKPAEKIKISIYSNNKFELKILYTSNKEIQTKVDNIIDNWIEKNITAGMSDYQKVKMIHDFIIVNFEYTFGVNGMNNGYSVYDTSSIVLSTGGVCNAYADLFEVMATKSGVKSVKVIGTATNSTSSGDHAWNIVTINGKNYHVDTTWDDVLGFKGGQVIYDYFLKSDSFMSKHHIWNSVQYPKANEDYNTGLGKKIYNINLNNMVIKNNK